MATLGGRRQGVATPRPDGRVVVAVGVALLRRAAPTEDVRRNEEEKDAAPTV
jgi:hypothetical protein